jgi:hypothetical protein
MRKVPNRPEGVYVPYQKPYPAAVPRPDVTVSQVRAPTQTARKTVYYNEYTIPKAEEKKETYPEPQKDRSRSAV